MAKRKTAWTPDKVRQRIQVGVLVTRLKDHALGAIEMSATQIKAAEILLRKAVPDLKSVEHSGTITRKAVSELSMQELDERIARLAAREAEPASGAAEPSPVH
jgi:hypothetical protein